ncbi:MAG: FKBP-type peptidyl-prolyl cis-trans isomerase [Sphingomonas sp.]|uniref:FKBP-type peptidyl-prolyl cis-trans isomerase n=1 Tax=Sphingomonas sp. TaxID=28214 RepID=UPI003F7DC243
MRVALAISGLIAAATIVSTAPATAQQAPSGPVATVASTPAPDASFLAANRKKPGVIQTASGLQYQMLAAGDGPSPTDNDVVLVNYIGKLTDDSVFDRTPQPMAMPVAGLVPGFAEALKLMRKGAKYRVWIPANLAYGDRATGPIPASATLVFDIELLDFMSREAYASFGRQVADAALVPPSIGETTFLAKNRIAPGVVETRSGLQYRVLVPGDGSRPTDDDVALVNYEGRLSDGTVFDKSSQPTPIPVQGVVPGFAEALKLMRKHEKLRVWIPAQLGYGAEEQRDGQGKVAIPANSLTEFDIELIDFLPRTVLDNYRRQMEELSKTGGAPMPPPPSPSVRPTGSRPVAK